MVKCGMGSGRRSPNELIRRELVEVLESPIDGCEVMYDDHEWPPKKSIQGFLIGPQNSPYENGLFTFTYTYPEDFPHSRPVMKILTKIVHPAVVKGKVCLKGLYEGATLRETLLELQEELLNPNFEQCANEMVREHHSLGKFVQKARRATRNFAR